MESSSSTETIEISMSIGSARTSLEERDLAYHVHMWGRVDIACQRGVDGKRTVRAVGRCLHQLAGVLRDAAAQLRKLKKVQNAKGSSFDDFVIGRLADQNRVQADSLVAAADDFDDHANNAEAMKQYIKSSHGMLVRDYLHHMQSLDASRLAERRIKNVSNRDLLKGAFPSVIPTATSDMRVGLILRDLEKLEHERLDWLAREMASARTVVSDLLNGFVQAADSLSDILTIADPDNYLREFILKSSNPDIPRVDVAQPDHIVDLFSDLIDADPFDRYRRAYRYLSEGQKAIKRIQQVLIQRSQAVEWIGGKLARVRLDTMQYNLLPSERDAIEALNEIFSAFEKNLSSLGRAILGEVKDLSDLRSRLQTTLLDAELRANQVNDCFIACQHACDKGASARTKAERNFRKIGLKFKLSSKKKATQLGVQVVIAQNNLELCDKDLARKHEQAKTAAGEKEMAIRDVMQTMDVAERERILYIKAIFQQVLNHEMRFDEETRTSVRRFERAVKTMDRDSDIAYFIRSHRASELCPADVMCRLRDVGGEETHSRRDRHVSAFNSSKGSEKHRVGPARPVLPYGIHEEADDVDEIVAAMSSAFPILLPELDSELSIDKDALQAA